MKDKKEKIDDIIQIMKQNSISCQDITKRMEILEELEIHKKYSENYAPLDLL